MAEFVSKVSRLRSRQMQHTLPGTTLSRPTIGLKAGGPLIGQVGALLKNGSRLGLYRDMGLDSPEAVIENYHGLVSSWDANDLIALASTWQNNNVGNTKGFNGDPEQALRSIKARVLYMPSETDMYFHIDALRQEAQFIPGVQFTVIPTLWGHIAEYWPLAE